MQFANSRVNSRIRKRFLHVIRTVSLSINRPSFAAANQVVMLTCISNERVA